MMEGRQHEEQIRIAEGFGALREALRNTLARVASEGRVFGHEDVEALKHTLFDRKRGGGGGGDGNDDIDNDDSKRARR